MRFLKIQLNAKHLRYCSPAGTFNPNTYTESAEKIKTWENAWAICHSSIRPKDMVLDLGGASTLLSFYLASIKCRVRIIDNDWGNCGSIYNTHYVAKIMNWDIRAHDRDLSQVLPFKGNFFDRVFSICVLEHLSCEVRRFMMREVGRVLKEGGIAALTFDYGSDRNGLLSDKGLRFAFRDKIERDVIQPSGLKVLGNLDWVDFISQKGFVGGALFLKK
ncbi:MAG: class I SAM-dependent methyltransferase [Candidatus Omnitrophota bacterium]